MDLGGNRRGVDMGPSAIRYAGLRDRLAALGYSVRDRGNIRVADRDEGASQGLRQLDKSELAAMGHRAHHVDEIIRVAEDLAKVVAEIERAGNIAIVLGGDHSRRQQRAENVTVRERARHAVRGRVRPRR